MKTNVLFLSILLSILMSCRNDSKIIEVRNDNIVQYENFNEKKIFLSGSFEKMNLDSVMLQAGIITSKSLSEDKSKIKLDSTLYNLITQLNVINGSGFRIKDSVFTKDNGKVFLPVDTVKNFNEFSESSTLFLIGKAYFPKKDFESYILQYDYNDKTGYIKKHEFYLLNVKNGELRSLTRFAFINEFEGNLGIGYLKVCKDGTLKFFNEIVGTDALDNGILSKNNHEYKNQYFSRFLYSKSGYLEFVPTQATTSPRLQR